MWCFAILIVMFGTISILKTATNIFPPIKIPVIAAIWTYTGLFPADMSGRMIRRLAQRRT